MHTYQIECSRSGCPRDLTLGLQKNQREFIRAATDRGWVADPFSSAWESSRWVCPWHASMVAAASTKVASFERPKRRSQTQLGLRRPPKNGFMNALGDDGWVTVGFIPKDTGQVFFRKADE